MEMTLGTIFPRQDWPMVEVLYTGSSKLFLHIYNSTSGTTSRTSSGVQPGQVGPLMDVGPELMPTMYATPVPKGSGTREGWRKDRQASRKISI